MDDSGKDLTQPSQQSIDSAKKAVIRLLSRNEDDLYVELGLRQEAVNTNLLLGSRFDLDVALPAGLGDLTDSLRRFGRAYTRKINRNVFDFVCGSSTQDSHLRTELRSALGVSKESFAALLAVGLVTYFGIMPALAAVLAAIVVRLFVADAGKIACEIWKQQLEENEPMT